MAEYKEYNFDGLVGPTHNYSGLSVGNVASIDNKASTSRPRDAALQGLKKMKALHDRGFAQAVLPPQERPAVNWLRRFGFEGRDDAEIIRKAAERSPAVFAACSSASSMWTANAATVAPSCDTADGRLHVTPANLACKLHRSIEAETTWRILGTIFGDADRFAVHRPIDGGSAMSDEGAANHTRLSTRYGTRGVHLFAYGRVAQDPSGREPRRFPARQTRESCEAIARLHRLEPEQAVFALQNPDAIDAGVFHNDVICVGNLDVLFYHEQAFAEKQSTLTALQQAFGSVAGRDLRLIEVSSDQVSLTDAVKTYLFNSQLLDRGDGSMLLVAPEECRKSEAVSSYLDNLTRDSASPIRETLYFDLRESMRNGGGPACLRQRIVLSDEEAQSIGARVFLDDVLYQELVDWVNRHYREELGSDDLKDPALLAESREALDRLCGILRLGSVYPFQRE